MDWINALGLSVSLAVDATVVGSTDGLKEPQMRIIKAMLIALTFGLFQAVMPTIGYFIGISFRDYVVAYVPWIAFVLLLLLGVKSLVDFILEQRKAKKGEEAEEAHVLKVPEILYQGVATAIDALCVGFVYMESPIVEALGVFGIIGGGTFLFSFGGVLLGKFLGAKIVFFQRFSGLISAVIFIAIGTKILLQGIL